jgi:hypothetical protein
MATITMGVLTKFIHTLTPHIGVLEKEFLYFCKTRFYLPFHPGRKLESIQHFNVQDYFPSTVLYKYCEYNKYTPTEVHYNFTGCKI